MSSEPARFLPAQAFSASCFFPVKVGSREDHIFFCSHFSDFKSTGLRGVEGGSVGKWVKKMAHFHHMINININKTLMKRICSYRRIDILSRRGDHERITFHEIFSQRVPHVSGDVKFFTVFCAKLTNSRYFDIFLLLSLTL